MNKKKTGKQRLPPGWTEKEIQDLATYYDNQSEDEQVAEHEAALRSHQQTVMVVPTELVPEIRKLISRRRTA
jgi:hypothetical protein